MVRVTQHRCCVLDDAAPDWLRHHVTKICRTLDCTPLACVGTADHIHALVNAMPKLSASVLVNSLKGTSNSLLRRKRPHTADDYWNNVSWSPSYFAANTGEATREIVE
ncbi:IS200/IS605 family transposase [Skermanella aerolata]|uniref:IS200/IS605 family transposase n=1 Tax=Skermanella aerolata TaxID=393310 RepID=UPI003D25E6C3